MGMKSDKTMEQVSVSVPAELHFEVWVPTATKEGSTQEEQIDTIVARWLGGFKTPKIVSLTPLGIGLRQVKLQRTGPVTRTVAAPVTTEEG